MRDVRILRVMNTNELRRAALLSAANVASIQEFRKLGTRAQNDAAKKAAKDLNARGVVRQNGAKWTYSAVLVTC
jgi:hypothetical protein